MKILLDQDAPKFPEGCDGGLKRGYFSNFPCVCDPTGNFQTWVPLVACFISLFYQASSTRVDKLPAGAYMPNQPRREHSFGPPNLRS